MTMVVASVAIWCWRGATGQAQGPGAPAAGRTLPSAAQAEPPPPVLSHETPAAPATRPTGSANPSASSPGASAALAEASAALAAGNLVQARRVLNQATDPLADNAPNEQILQQLAKLGDEMIFSTKILQNDPLVIKHVVEPGQNLQKIANLYKTTAPLICRVNGLANGNSLRQGQPLKVVLGPFHATVCKHSFRMYVYCQDTLVKILPVGLGMDDKTPTGHWKIRNKLTNPRYYPPDGGPIIEPNDPKNPLGEYWIGLDGFEGAAVGKEGFGIHGTIEPQSIGTKASKGCIRLRSEDIMFVYELLVRHDSIVTVAD